jgi:hypothetical protein
MIIGLKYGQCTASDKASKDKCYKLTSEFMEEYMKRKGTVICRELLGYDVRNIEARAMFPGRQKEVCPKVIEAAVLILKKWDFNCNVMNKLLYEFVRNKTQEGRYSYNRHMSGPDYRQRYTKAIE